MKNIVERQFSKSVETYDDAAIAQRQIALHLSDQILRYCQVVEKIYEIGAGTGLLTKCLVQKLQINKLIINDLSIEMEKPISRVLASYPNKKWTFLAGNAEYLPIPSGTTLVVSSSSFQWFSNLASFFLKTGKHLSEGSLLAFSTFGTDNLHECRAILGTGLQYVEADMLDQMLEPNFEIIYRHEEKITLWFDSPRDILLHMKKTGVNSFGDSPSSLAKSLGKGSVWTPAKMRNFEDAFQREFESEGKYPLTYHPIYRIAQRKE
jgi:malonyl-ACP O-methyltransferase BioC